MDRTISRSSQITIDTAQPMPFKEHANGGSLVALTESAEVPFDIKRIFYVWDVPDNETRGKHAHYECDQLLICLKGTLKVLIDDGSQKKVQILDSPGQGLLIPAGLWAEETYIDNAIMVVLCSHEYDTEDYIHSYKEFVEWKSTL